MSHTGAKRPRLEEDIEQMLECCICTEITKDPKMLPCAHWFCANCLQSYIEKHDGDLMFSCPFCRKQIPIPRSGVAEFPAALDINRLREAVENKVRCTKHHKEFGLFCEPCEELLCLECVLDHEGHTKVHLRNFVQRHQEVLIQSRDKLGERIKQYETVLNKIDRNETSIEQRAEFKKKAVKENIAELIKQLQAFIPEMEQGIDTKLSYIKAVLKQIRDRNVREMSCLIDCSSTIEAVINDEDEKRNAKSLQSVHECRQLLQTLTADWVKSEVPKLEISFEKYDVSTGQLSRDGNFYCCVNSAVLMEAPELQMEGKTIELSYGARGAAFLSDGHIAVCDDKNPGRVLIHKSDGQQVRVITPGVGELYDVAHHEGCLYITECITDNGRVLIYDTEGKHKYTVTVGYKGAAGITVTDSFMFVTSSRENCVYRLNMPAGDNKQIFAEQKDGIEAPYFVASNDKYCCVSSTNTGKVFLYNMNGVVQYSYGGIGAGPGQLNTPRGVAMDPTTLFICEREYDRLFVISTNGNYIASKNLRLEGLKSPLGLAVSPTGNIAVTSAVGKCLVIYSKSVSKMKNRTNSKNVD